MSRKHRQTARTISTATLTSELTRRLLRPLTALAEAGLARLLALPHTLRAIVYLGAAATTLAVAVSEQSGLIASALGPAALIIVSLELAAASRRREARRASYRVGWLKTA